MHKKVWKNMKLNVNDSHLWMVELQVYLYSLDSPVVSEKNYIKYIFL